MSKKKLTMKRIATPSWAMPYAVSLENVSGKEAFDVLQRIRKRLLKIVQKSVQEYVIESEEDGNSFPEASRMTGEYYIGREYYQSPPLLNEQECHSVSIMVHCLEKQRIENQKDFDYLGLDVHIYLDKKSLKVLYVDVDSSSI